MTTVRTFIAIELAENLKQALRRSQAFLAEQVPARSVRWVSPEGIHLTLKFLGDTPLDRVDRVKAAVAQAAADAQAFSFSLGGLGCFPNTRQPRVVWVATEEPTGALARLQKAVESHVSPQGFPSEKRPFSPHLTLGRVHRYASHADVQRIGAVVAGCIGPLGEMTVNRILYIQSDLRPTGAVYTPLFEAPLGTAQDPLQAVAPGRGVADGESGDG